MNNKVIIITMIAYCIASEKCFAQIFDSVHIYALHINTSYYIKIDKDLIKNEVDPIVLTDQHQINAIYLVLRDTIKNGKAKKLENNHLDIRLSFEFFKRNKVIQVVGVTPYNTMFINYTLYVYDRQRLKYLDRYIPELSKKIGVN